MATYQAIEVTCRAVIELLESTYESLSDNERLENFNDTGLEFMVYSAENFASPMNAGVSLFLYRIFPNGSHRTPHGRFAPGGQRYRSQLPLDLHFLLTAWGNDASLQHTIAGWMMRILEDRPILPAGFLAAIGPDVFGQDESVELSLTDLRTEDLLRIWETLSQDRYYISLPYVARNVRIESMQLRSDGQPIQERLLGVTKDVKS